MLILQYTKCLLLWKGGILLSSEAAYYCSSNVYLTIQNFTIAIRGFLAKQRQSSCYLNFDNNIAFNYNFQPLKINSASKQSCTLHNCITAGSNGICLFESIQMSWPLCQRKTSLCCQQSKTRALNMHNSTYKGRIRIILAVNKYVGCILIDRRIYFETGS